jgi:hypothetical protein
MAKDTYYFSHDSNARHDPKITAMRGVYGAEGYGWFFMLIEMMREADGYKLDMQSKYAFNAYAMQLQCECNAIASFVHDCINEFSLFSSDGCHFWSESLLRRMEKAQNKSDKARESARARWSKSKKNANASKGDANASKNDAIKESKVNEIKDRLLDLINSNEIKYEKRDQIDIVCSYINQMDVEVIEDVINRGKGNHINYVLKALRNRVFEGKTTKDTITPLKVVDKKKDPELETRHRDIALTKWIDSGGDPSEFRYPAS